MTTDFSGLQSSDFGETTDALASTIESKQQDVQEERARAVEAYARKLIRAAQMSLSGVDQDSVSDDASDRDILREIHHVLRLSPKIEEVMSPATDSAVTPRSASLFRRLCDRYDADQPVTADKTAELQVYVEAAESLGWLHSITDMTRYAPIRLETLDVAGSKSRVTESSPLGRLRIAHDDPSSLEKRSVEIPHEDCEHILMIANPRKGKDSLACRIAGNLKDEHGYKWFSLFDDGRNETPMISIPNTEDAIQESLENVGENPKGYKSHVWVPNSNLPDRLPQNHQPFSIGVDSLTPGIIASLSGVSPESSVERRIKQALDDAMAHGGDVDILIDRLEELAGDTAAVVEVTERVDDGGSEETSARSYEMGEASVLEDCAESLMLLASEGLLVDAGDPLALDMPEILGDQDHVAILNCNFLADGDEHLKFLLVNLWMQLIFRARDTHPDLPRAVLELREIKNLAPSKLGDTKYRQVVQSLRQTIYRIASQGGSRRVMMVGSTQKLNDVYKAVRGNFPLKIVLQIGEEKINTLRSAGFQFDNREKDQLKGFRVGWGMLISHDGKHYPIQWSGARCGLGLGDQHWLTRYADAAGARIHSPGESFDADTWIDMDGGVHHTDTDGAPDTHQWYLTPEDITGDIDGEPILDDAVIQKSLATRQDTPAPPQDLRPTDVSSGEIDREMTMMASDRAEQAIQSESSDSPDLVGVLAEWAEYEQDKFNRMMRTLETVERHELGSYDDIAQRSGVKRDTLSKYIRKQSELGSAVEKHDGVYRITETGYDALHSVDWDAARQ